MWVYFQQLSLGRFLNQKKNDVSWGRSGGHYVSTVTQMESYDVVYIH